MDFKLENENLGLLEKNKRLFTDITKDKKGIEEILDELNENTDTFQMYADFMSEKNTMIEIINEIVEFSLFVCSGKDANYNLKNIKKVSDMINFKNRIIMILETYQEQPGLIDPILGLIVPVIMNKSLIIIEYLLNNKDGNENIMTCLQCLYQIIYILCKIRGFQTIIKFFSSEVQVFEPVITFLLSINPDITDNWTLVYVLLLWTSILGLIPFDIETIDTNGIITSGLNNYYKRTLCFSGILRDVSAYSLSKFLTRPDVIKKNLLEQFLHYSISTLQSQTSDLNIFISLGLASALYEIFKNGLPKDLSNYAEFVIENAIKFKYSSSIEKSGNFRKFIAKLAQRVGLVLLKPKFQKWRYTLNYATLLNLDSNQQSNIIDEQCDEDELNYEINFELLETLIDYLLNGLAHKEYIVRWSSAKGIGRLCERLTKVMVDDILKSVYNLFENEENEFSWQGACFCIAELCKRGMVLPDNLGTIVKYLEKALIFEVNRGTFCSGSYVRDSACYVVWALARAYSRDVMRPHVTNLAKSLLLTILFDKEVNCRRAASAAFQEHVGRQGYFPHGIEIITEADYFTIGNIIYCYLNISTFISQYLDYHITIIDYLSFNRLIHVEQSIREVTAEALGLIVPFSPHYFTNEIIIKLLDLCYSNTLHVRHGAIIGIGYILVGLSGKWDFENKSKIIRKKVMEGLNTSDKNVLVDSEYRKSFENNYAQIKYNNNLNMVSEELSLKISSLPAILDKKNLYRGKGGEIMRTAVNNLIRLISQSGISIGKENLIYFFDVLIDNLKHPNQDIQKEACEGLKTLNESYFKIINEDESIFSQIEIKYKQVVKLSVTDESIYVTKGFTMSLPYFDCELLLRNYQETMESLFTNAKIKKYNNNDAETRKYSIESLCSLASKFFIKNPELISRDLDKIISYCLEGLDDYEIDKKLGDVGSKVREASMKSLTSLMIDMYNSNSIIFFDLFKKYSVIYLKGLFKQISEKMAKIRLAAGDSLQRFFNEMKNNDLSDFIPHYEHLKIAFIDDIKFNDNNFINNTQWLQPSYGYKRIMHIMLLEEYSFNLFQGLIISIGGITEDTQKFSLEELDNLINSLDDESRYKLVKNIYGYINSIFVLNEKNDRVMEPLMNTLSHLFTKVCFINNKFMDEIDKLHKFIAKENFESNNIHKFLSSVDVLYNLLYFEIENIFNLYKRCLKSLLVLMTHKFPVVRKKAAEKLYIYFIGLEDPATVDLTYDEIDNINIFLSETNWADPISVIREQRNSIAKILKIDLKNLTIVKK